MMGTGASSLHDPSAEELQEGADGRDRLQLAGRIGVAMVAACPFPANRGTPFRILQMGEALSALGYDVHTVTYHLGEDRPTPGMQIHRTLKLDWYQEYNAGPNFAKLLVLDPLLVRRLLEVVRRHRIRIIHAHHFEGALCALIVKRIVGNLRIIYDAHTTLSDELMDYKSFRVPRWIKKVASDLLDAGIPRWCDHTVVVSRRLASSIRKHGVPSSRISFIPMAVNTEEFRGEAKEVVRKELGLPDRPTIVYTGSLAPFQGIEHLLQAMAAVVLQRPDCYLLVAGRGSARYQDLTRTLGLKDHVRYIEDPPFTDVKRYLSAADVVTAPRENCVGFPLKLLNYMAAGKAIVAFEGGSADVLRDRVNGIVVPDGDERAFAEGLLHCLENPAERDDLGRQARQDTAEFDLATMTERVGAVYRRLLAHQGLLWAPTKRATP